MSGGLCQATIRKKQRAAWLQEELDKAIVAALKRIGVIRDEGEARGGKVP